MHVFRRSGYIRLVETARREAKAMIMGKKRAVLGRKTPFDGCDHEFTHVQCRRVVISLNSYDHRTYMELAFIFVTCWVQHTLKISQGNHIPHSEILPRLHGIETIAKVSEAWDDVAGSVY